MGLFLLVLIGYYKYLFVLYLYKDLYPQISFLFPVLVSDPYSPIPQGKGAFIFVVLLSMTCCSCKQGQAPNISGWNLFFCIIPKLPARVLCGSLPGWRRCHHHGARMNIDIAIYAINLPMTDRLHKLSGFISCSSGHSQYDYIRPAQAERFYCR